MSKRSGTPKKTKSPLSNPAILTAVIGGIVTIVVALVGILPPLLDYLSKKQAPQASATPVVVFVTETAPPITPTFISTKVPTETVTVATDTPVAALLPSISCLDQWEIVNSNKDLQAAPIAQGNCMKAGVPELGISASSDGLFFVGTNVLRESAGIFGVAVQLPNQVKVEFQAHLSRLYNAGFWIGLSATPEPKDNMMILAMQASASATSKVPGNVDLYVNQFGKSSEQYLWSRLRAGLNLPDGPPYLYVIRFDIDNGKIDTYIDGVKLNSQIVGQPIYLFLGFYKKSIVGSTTLQVNVDNWKITAGD